MKATTILLLATITSALSLSAQTLNDITYSGDTLPGQNYSSYVMNNVTFENSDMHGSNFSNATLNNFTIFVTEDSGLSNLDTERYFANLDFSSSVWTGGKISGLTRISISNVTQETFAPVVLKNVNFSGAALSGVEFSSIDAIKGSTSFKGANLSGSNFYHVNLQGADSGLFEDAIINGVFFNQVSGLNVEMLAKSGSYKNGNLSGLLINGYVNSPTDLSGMDFSGMNLQGMGTSSVNLSNANFTGADLRGSSFSSMIFDPTAGAIYKNTIMSDGKINNLSLNSEGDVLMVRANETNAKIAENAVLSAGSIELLDGAKLELADGVAVTLSDGIVISFEGDISDASDLLLMGDNSTIVMAGYESNEAAQAAFIGLFKDSEGNSVDWAPESVASFVTAAIPEPSTYAAIFGALAIAFAAYRRRK